MLRCFRLEKSGGSHGRKKVVERRGIMSLRVAAVPGFRHAGQSRLSGGKLHLSQDGTGDTRVM